MFLFREMGSFDSTQLRALKEHLPSSEERKGLELYMGKAGDSEEKKQFFYADLSDCEKYMHTIMNVTQADKKFDCMIFRSQFQSRYDELLESIRLIEKAIDEVRNSDALRQIMGLILVLVNEINTGGEAKGAAEGFSLEALLKLNEVSAVQFIPCWPRRAIPDLELDLGESFRQEDKCATVPG